MEKIGIIWLIFCPLDPDPWIRMFLRIRIQEAALVFSPYVSPYLWKKIKFDEVRIMFVDF